MKRFLLCFIIIVFSLIANAQTNTWIGGASGTWSNTSNWSLGHAPSSAEDVLINTNSSIDMNSFIAGARSVNSLKVTGSVIAKLTCSINGTRSLKISSTSSVTKGLQVDAGSRLIFDAANSTGTGNFICDLTGAAGVTGLIDGTLQFEGNGAGTGTACLKVYTNASNNASLAVSGTGRIIHMIDTGDDISASGSYLTMQAGSVFEMQDDGGSIPNGNWNAGSTVKLNITGTTSPVFTGTNYGNLEVNCNLSSPVVFNKDISFNDVNLVSTGASTFGVRSTPGTVPFTLTVNGNLTVSSSSTVELATNVSLFDSSGNIKLKGNVTNNGTIKAIDGSTENYNRFEFNGTSGQTISGSGAWFGNHLCVMLNNTSGVTLLSPLLLQARLLFGNGNLKTSATNILTMAKGNGYSAIWTGASAASFIDGPMRNVSTGTWITFPIGKGSIYAPIGYYHILNHMLTDTFRAEYFRANPQGVYGNSYDAAGNPEVIHHISNVEYWTLTSNGIFTTNSIEPHVMPTSFCQDMSNTFTVRFDPATSKWKNAGTFYRNVESPGPPYATGYLQSSYSEMGIFTLATSSAANILGVAESSLPIHLITFDAVKLNSSTSWVTWETADFSSAAEKFEIQKAGSDKKFTTIGIANGKENDRLYNYTDNDLKTGVSFYRLKMTDKDGKITYTKTVAVMNDVKGFLVTSLVPTIVSDKATLTVASSDRQKMDIIVVDMQGRVMLRRNFTIAAGNTNIELSLSRLEAGAYMLTAITEQGKTTTRFVKQ